MALQNAVQGDQHTAQQITWYAGTAVKNLTGAVITGTITDANGTIRAITGALTFVTPASGVFNWQYSAVDTGTAGSYQVQFTATYAADSLADSTFLTSWVVQVKH
jgi:hypothetical protein